MLPVQIALMELGVSELPGDKHNERILEYLATCTNIGAIYRSQDETPWCSAFVNWCYSQAGLQGTSSALARSWLSFGSEVSPGVGTVAVLKRRRAGPDRRTGSRGGYHVVFHLSSTPRRIQALSGNSSDRVGIDWFSLSKWEVLAHRS